MLNELLILDDLLHGYNVLPWYKKLFYPGALSAALTQYARQPSCDSAVVVLTQGFFARMGDAETRRVVEAFVADQDPPGRTKTNP